MSWATIKNLKSISVSFSVCPQRFAWRLTYSPLYLAITLFSFNEAGFFFFETSEVVASASMFKTNSKLVMLS